MAIKRWEWFLYALVMVVLTIASIVIMSIIWGTYFNDPPIVVTSLDPDPLGVFCGGELLPVHNQVSINDAIIVIYYLTTINPETGANLIDTQKAYTDMQYPNKVHFVQTLPWTVPNLPPGKYVRSFAARNVEGAQHTVFVERRFEIQGC